MVEHSANLRRVRSVQITQRVAAFKTRFTRSIHCVDMTAHVQRVGNLEIRFETDRSEIETPAGKLKETLIKKRGGDIRSQVCHQRVVLNVCIPEIGWSADLSGRSAQVRVPFIAQPIRQSQKVAKGKLVVAAQRKR